MAKAALTPPLRASYRVTTEGAENLPAAGPVVLAANHRSFMDSIFLALVVSRPISFVAKAEYFERRLTAWALRATGQIALRRGNPASAREAHDAAVGVLGRGGVVGVYPEGTRSRDGLLHRAGIGTARLAADGNAQIVPMGLVGTEEVQAPGQVLPRLAKSVTVRFGEPFEPSGNVRRRRLRELTEEMMARIAGLSGQEYEGPRRPVLAR